jgi:The GLUG motif.
MIQRARPRSKTPLRRFAAILALLISSALLAGCANLLAAGSGKGSVSLSISNPGSSSKAIVPSATDYSSAEKSYLITVSGNGNTYTSSSVTGGVCTITGIAAGSYTVSVAAYCDAVTRTTGTQIASGSASSVSISAGSSTPVSITLSFSHAAAAGATNAGGFSLPIAWYSSATLPYVYARLDGASGAIVASATGSAGSPYTATLAASGVAGGAHSLYIYFAASSAATTSIGPFVESLNIWDGVTDTMWADSNGNLQPTLTLYGSEFAGSDTTLAGISVSSTTVSGFSASTYTYSYPISLSASTAYPVTVTTSSANQNVTCTLDDATAVSLNATSSTILSGTFTTASSGPNTLKFVVTAADRKTTQTYCVTAATLLTSGTVSSALNSNLAGNYVLSEDTSISSNSNLLGSYGSPFTGTFDGNGHTVTLNLTSTEGALPYRGLFPQNQGTIKNVHVAVNIAQTSNDIAGGLVAINEGTIYHCYSTGTVTANTGSNCSFIGGLVGENKTSGIIKECYSVAKVTSINTAAGGLVGDSQGGQIINCYARGQVLGTSIVGGLAGEYNPVAATTLTNCYSTGAVSGTSYVCGFYSAGAYTTPTANNCFFDSTVNSTVSDSFAVGKATAAMKSAATFGSWSISESVDSSKVWGISSSINDGYPYLQYFGSNTVKP